MPSRIHPGTFYALPQAPQQYKQLIMVSGFDRYFQIAPCFRDEDPRADRLPGEFYQLDLEMSFVEQDDVLSTMEPVMRGVFETFADGKPVTQKFPRIPYDVAMRKYGSDKPDLRNPIEMQDVSEHFRDSGFKVFANILANDPKAEVWAIPAKTGGSRAFCDRMNSWAQGEGQPGLGYIFWRKEGDKLEGAGPLAKNIGEERTEAIRHAARPCRRRRRLLRRRRSEEVRHLRGCRAHPRRRGTEPRRPRPFRTVLDRRLPVLRMERGGEEDRLRPQPVLDAAGRHRRAERARIRSASRRSSTTWSATASRSPRAASATICRKPWSRRSRWSGWTAQTVEERFGGLYRAFQYGAPPHGGMAAGIDRIVMLLVGAKNLREITHVPDEPAGLRPVDERAVGSDAAAAARAVAARGAAEEGSLTRASVLSSAGTDFELIQQKSPASLPGFLHLRLSRLISLRWP